VSSGFLDGCFAVLQRFKIIICMIYSCNALMETQSISDKLIRHPHKHTHTSAMQNVCFCVQDNLNNQTCVYVCFNNLHSHSMFVCMCVGNVVPHFWGPLAKLCEGASIEIMYVYAIFQPRQHC